MNVTEETFAPADTRRACTRACATGSASPSNWISCSSSSAWAVRLRHQPRGLHAAGCRCWTCTTSWPPRSPSSSRCINNFWLNRHWTFAARDGHAGFQAARFFTVSVVAFLFSLAVLELLVRGSAPPRCWPRRCPWSPPRRSTSSGTRCGASAKAAEPSRRLAALAAVVVLLALGACSPATAATKTGKSAFPTLTPVPTAQTTPPKGYRLTLAPGDRDRRAGAEDPRRDPPPPAA